jgi:anaphase-promoting complex subunit 6
MDPRFSPSWVAYAHTFSFEKEHEQAIIAYSSSARSYVGYVLIPVSIDATLNVAL